VAASCGSKDNVEEGSSLRQITIENVTAKDGYPLSNVDSVRLRFYYERANIELACAAFTNSKAVINLPASVENKYLATSFFADLPAEIKVSNPNVKAVKADLRTNFGRFQHAVEGWSNYLIYVNENVTITGTGTGVDGGGTSYQIKYSMELKKGWNMVYWTDDIEPFESTTKAPAGVGWVHGS
jgi:hypothetical protein